MHRGQAPSYSMRISQLGGRLPIPAGHGGGDARVNAWAQKAIMGGEAEAWGAAHGSTGECLFSTLRQNYGKIRGEAYAWGPFMWMSQLGDRLSTLEPIGHPMEGIAGRLNEAGPGTVRSDTRKTTHCSTSRACLPHTSHLLPLAHLKRLAGHALPQFTDHAPTHQRLPAGRMHRTATGAGTYMCSPPHAPPGSLTGGIARRLLAGRGTVKPRPLPRAQRSAPSPASAGQVGECGG